MTLPVRRPGGIAALARWAPVLLQRTLVLRRWYGGSTSLPPASRRPWLSTRRRRRSLGVRLFAQNRARELQRRLMGA